MYLPQTVDPHLRALRAVLAALAANAREAGRLGRSPWEYALSEADLREIGLADADRRLLLEGGYLQAGSPPGRRGPLHIATPAGRRLARALARPDRWPSAAAKPHWDPARRVVEFRRKVVKRVGAGADQQELLLGRLEEAGWVEWPEWLPDPYAGSCADGRRLREGVRSLNVGLRGPLEFLVDGRRRRFTWRRLSG